MSDHEVVRVCPQCFRTLEKGESCVESSCLRKASLHLSMTIWHYTEDVEWPEEFREVFFCATYESEVCKGFLRRYPLGNPRAGQPQRWEGLNATCYSQENDRFDLTDVYAWAELPEKAPVREAGRSCTCAGRGKVRSLQELCKFCRDEIDYEEDDDLMPGGFND